MMHKFWKLIREDWERQPLAIIAQATSIVLAIGFAISGSIAAPSSGGFSYSGSGAATALAVTVLVSSVGATACRSVFKSTVIGGFMASLILASSSILLFSQMATNSLIRTSVYVDRNYEGPLIDIAYWAVFCVFAAVCAAPAITRILATWGELRSEAAVGERGVAPIELIIFAMIWGWCLSGSQQRIIGAFVFDRVPQSVHVQTRNSQ